MSTRPLRPHGRAAVVAASLLLPLALSGCSGSETSEPRATPTDATGAASPLPSDDASAGEGTAGRELVPVEVPPRVRQETRAGIRGFVAATGEALADPEAARRGELPLARGGGAEEQLLTLANEYAANGWRTEGIPKVVGFDVVERTRRPRTITAAVCIDSSGVTVLDANGDPTGLEGNRTDRSLNLLTLVRRDGSWVVADQTFPDDPDC